MNDRDILIGIDAGTSVIKSVAFDLGGRQLAVSALPNRYRTGPEGSAVQNMAWTWEATAQTLRQLGERLSNLASRVAAIGVTGQGDGTWLIDSSGNPVGDAWLWFDARASSRVDYLKSKPEDETRYLTTGTGLNSCQMGAQLGRMRDITPEVFDTAATALHCKDWLYFKMTGARRVDPSEAVFTFGDFRTRLYCPQVIEALELEPLSHLLPPILDGTRETHPLTSQAALQTGLLAGTPVALGAVDVICTALGGGAVQ